MRVQHRLPLGWHRWAFDIGCDPAVGVASQEWHNLQDHSSDSDTKNKHATRVEVGHYTRGNPQAMLLKLVCNSCSCHLQGEHCITRSRPWNFVHWWDARVPTGEPHSVPLGMFAADSPPASEEYCGSWLELAGEWLMWRCALRLSGRSWKIDCKLSYI